LIKGDGMKFLKVLCVTSMAMSFTLSAFGQDQDECRSDRDCPRGYHCSYFTGGRKLCFPNYSNQLDSNSKMFQFSNKTTDEQKVVLSTKSNIATNKPLVDLQ